VIFLARYRLSGTVGRKVETCLVRGELGMDELGERVVVDGFVVGEKMARLCEIVGGVFPKRAAYRL